MSPVERLATQVRAAMVPLQDAHSNSPIELKQRQSRVYAELWKITEKHIPAPQRRER